MSYTITDSQGNEVASVTDMYRGTNNTLNNCVGWESEDNDLSSTFYYTFLLTEDVLKADETYTITWKVDNYVYNLFDGFVYEDTLTSTVKTSERNEKGDIDAGSIKVMWHSYKLNLHANDGTDTVESLYGTCRFEDAGYVDNKNYNFTIPESAPALVGYVFQGWAKTADADKAEYQPGLPTLWSV